MRVFNGLFLAVFMVLGTPAVAGVNFPVHELIQELEGDYDGLTAQDDPRFGFSMAMEGDTLVVGAPGTVDLEPDPITKVLMNVERGVVFVFKREGGQWELDQRLRPELSLISGDARCGYSVSLVNNHLLVGCPNHIDGDSDQERGRAILYQRSDSEADFFTTGDTFDDSGDASGALCGYSVSIREGAGSGGNTRVAAVACPARGFDAGGGLLSRPGAVDIHVFGITGWNLAETILPPGGGILTPTGFGDSIQLHRHSGDDLLIIGRPGAGGGDGQVRIYERGDTLADWTLDRFYDGASNSAFGYSVHMSAGRLAVGAPTRRVPAPAPVNQIPVGSFSIAQRSCTAMSCSWQQQQQITEILGQWVVVAAVPQNRLGHAVRVLDGLSAPLGEPRVIAGEPLWPIVNQIGRARHYLLDGSDWVLNENEPFYEAGTPAPAALGSSFANDGDWLAIGAPGYPVQNEGPRGRVFLYVYGNSLFSDRFEQ